MHVALLDGAEIGEESIVGANALVLGCWAYPPAACSSGRGQARDDLTDEDLVPLAAVRGRYTARGRLYPEQGLARRPLRAPAADSPRPLSSRRADGADDAPATVPADG